MGTLLTYTGLSKIREKFKRGEFKDFENAPFDFKDIDIERSVNYPNISDELINKFNQSYQTNPRDEFTLAKLLYEAIPINRVEASNPLFWIT